MPDFERLFDRAVAVLGEHTKQTARLAFAVETLTLMRVSDPQVKTCPACSSRIQRHDAKQCLACGEDMKDG